MLWLAMLSSRLGYRAQQREIKDSRPIKGLTARIHRHTLLPSPSCPERRFSPPANQSQIRETGDRSCIMAQAGAAAGGEVVVAGGPGGDEEVPDVRFLMKPREQELFSQITSQEQEQLFVNYLRSKNVKQAELELSYRISDAMITQQPPVVALFPRGAALVVSSYRKRRRAIFLMMMQRSYGGCKNPKISVPFKYSNPAQLQGDIRSVKNQIMILYAELLDVCQQLKVMSQVPLTIPEVLHDPVEIPKAKK